MPKGMLFWMLYIICLVFSMYCYWPNEPSGRWSLGGSLVTFILIGILGWAVFGPPIQ